MREMNLSPTQKLRFLLSKWVLIEAALRETEEEPFSGKSSSDAIIIYCDDPKFKKKKKMWVS